MVTNKIRSFKLFFFIIAPYLLISCGTSNVVAQKIEGVYIQKEDKGIQLEINKNSFVLKDTYKQEHLPPYDCCDTIAYGKWEKDKELPLLTLSSSEELLNSNINDNSTYAYIDVKEEEKKTEKESIVFHITNPLENFYKKVDRKWKDIEYQLLISSNKSNYDNSIAVKRYSKNSIVIEKKENLNINEFEVVIYVSCKASVRNLEIREVYTMPYQVKNPKANVFKINIPQLDYGYLSYKRLNNDYVKIISKNKLLWDGKEYIRK
ncbi:hypothetical protein [Tenacibaculum maritimum]|uniref:hypothetical protein n=3 Tax=Tenacibaculum maritimum TaxID=107401 RepID=UPI0012E4A911|nr:hypothetical protein [Tenacibaculum maritimum]CAA0176289.1 conserved hypothetical protein [Tenacibaculum maritimum]